MMILKNKYFRFAAAVIAALIFYILAPASMPEAARRVLFVFIFAAILWAAEILPLYATSLVVVLLLTFMLCRPGGIMGMDEQGYTIFMVPFGSSIIMLFFGGLVIAEAMAKFSLDKVIASRMLKFFGHHPYSILAGFILITAFLSMWMSNTATTAMMIALIKPLLSQIKKDDPFRTGLALSIPFAANIGGIGTPIGTPPNAIALGILSHQGITVDFVSWMKMAVPLMLVLLVCVILVLIWLFPAANKRLNLVVEGADVALSHRAKLAALVVVATVAVWLTSEFHKIPSALVALTSAGFLVAAGFIEKKDLQNIDWPILILMWGGLALGKGLEISGLSKWIVSQPLFAQEGLLLILMFAVLTMLVSTFISNTATANLIIPIAVAIPGVNVATMAIITGLSCSFGMALPISTPPNTIAFSSGILRSRDMLKAGVCILILAAGIMLLGYQYMIPFATGGR